MMIVGACNGPRWAIFATGGVTALAGLALAFARDPAEEIPVLLVSALIMLPIQTAVAAAGYGIGWLMRAGYLKYVAWLQARAN